MAGETSYIVRLAGGMSGDAASIAERLRRGWERMPARSRDRVLRGFGQWLNILVRYIRANKLKGQVLKKREGAALYNSLGAQLNIQAARATIYETDYGAMWEHTGHGIIRPVNGCQCRICRSSSEKWLHWKSPDFGWVRTREVRAVGPKPHITPSIEEKHAERTKLIFEPLAREVLSAFRGGN